jgi:signal transduction histidine kinase
VQWLQGFMIGLALGSGLAALIAWWATGRYLRKLRQAQRRVKSAERLAEIGAMTSGLAHEIKNPLSTIGLNAQLIAEGVQEISGHTHGHGQTTDPEASARVARRAATLVRETERLKGILSDFLHFAGSPRLDRRTADLNTLVDEIADFFAPECQKHDIRLRVDLAPAPVRASIDAAQLKQSLLNLLLNAAQSIDSRGQASGEPREIILRVESDEMRTSPRRRVGLLGRTASEPEARIRVIDTGPGIAPETLTRIFEPYFTTKSSGTGLGLPTARRLIEAHGGRLDVHSELGRGTEFIASLPIDAGPTSARAHSLDQHDPDGSAVSVPRQAQT